MRCIELVPSRDISLGTDNGKESSSSSVLGYCYRRWQHVAEDRRSHAGAVVQGQSTHCLWMVCIELVGKAASALVPSSFCSHLCFSLP